MALSNFLFSFLHPAIPIILAAFGQVSKGQLVGCDAAGCPLNQFSRPQCEIGNLTAEEIGVANLSTSINPEPLTWTISTSDSTDPTNRSQGVFTRSFYLGTPPSLDLQTLTTYQSCALFFEGISSNLAFPLHDLDTDIGTCSDAMGSACVNDLMVQANSTLSNIMAGNNDTITMCQTLETMLRDNAPHTCADATNGSWGNISVKGLTGPSSSGPLQLGNCDPTTGKNYTISLINDYSITGPDITTFIGNFMGGITPIMTLFFPSESSTVEGNLTATLLGAPEFHLTCMKTVGSLAGCVGCGSSPGPDGSNSASSITTPAVQLAIMMAMATFSLVSV